MAGVLEYMACVMMACLVVLAPHGEAITCGQVTSNMLPCLNYLRGPGGSVPANCCSGVRGLNNAARTIPDKQTACGCLKNAYGAFPGIKSNLAEGLPKACGVSIPYKFSPTTDCSKIK